VRLAAGTIAAFQGHLMCLMEEIDRLGSLYEPGGLVFANEIGGIINPSNLRNRSSHLILMHAGLSTDTRIHDLRQASPQRQPFAPLFGL
jgi:integrase